MAEGDSTTDAWEEWSDAAPEPRKRRSLDAYDWAAIAVVAVVLLGLLLLRGGDISRDKTALSQLGIPSELYGAEIVSLEESLCEGTNDIVCTAVTFELLEGPDRGAQYIQRFPMGALNPDWEVGSEAILSRRSPNAIVRELSPASCSFAPDSQCITFTLDLLDDPGQQVTYEAAVGPAFTLGLGDEAVVDLFPGDDEATVFSLSPPDVQLVYQFTGDFQRRTVLWVVALLFAITVVALGRWRGIAALLGLTLSIGILLLFVLPAILSGRSPVLVAIVGAGAIAVVSLYLAHGYSRMTTVALLGMVAALVLTAGLSAITVELTHISGFTSEEAGLLTLFENIEVSGLILAGIVLGTAGALDDITVTQASAVWALKEADPTQSRTRLFQRAIGIGRDHIASTVNTLLLAYAGAALPLLVLFVLSDQSLGAIANSEIVAVEIIRTLIGSIGLVAAVPLTTLLATIAADGEPGHAHP